MRLFRRTARAMGDDLAEPGFRVRVKLTRGDRLLYRDTRGTIRIIRATEAHVELADVGGIAPRPAPDRRRRPHALRRWMRTASAGALA
jgi:hypothetical protein